MNDNEKPTTVKFLGDVNPEDFQETHVLVDYLQQQIMATLGPHDMFVLVLAHWTDTGAKTGYQLASCRNVDPGTADRLLNQIALRVRAADMDESKDARFVHDMPPSKN